MTPDDPFDGASGIDTAQAARLLERGGVAVLDVREPDEWRAGHIPGALHIPLGELGTRLDELPGEGTPLIVVCRSGVRSHYATEALAEIGLRVANLEGGMTAWHARRLAMEPVGGRVA